MKYGLNENIIVNLKNIFSLYSEIEEVILYGSRAKGNYKNGSDVDLTFTGDELNQNNLNTISLKIDDLYLPYTFDLSLYKSIKNSELLEHISRVGIKIYSKTV